MERPDAHDRQTDDEAATSANGFDPLAGRSPAASRAREDRPRRTPDDVPLNRQPPLTEPRRPAVDPLEELAEAKHQLRMQAMELEHTRSLLESERERFRELFEVAPEGHIITDPSGTIREANRGAAALLNIPIDYLLGKPLAVFIDPEERRAFRVRVYRARENRAEEAWRASLTPRGADALRVLLAASPLLDARGTVTGIRWLVRDVSNQRAALVWDRTPAAILRSAIDALSAHIAVVNADGTIVTVNRAWRDAVTPGGVFSAADAGSNYLDLCADAVAAGYSGASAVQSAVIRVLQGNGSRADALYSDRCTGGANDARPSGETSESWYSLRVTCCEGPEPTMVVVTHEDVTAERHAYEQETALLTERSARSAAEAANRAKSEFLTTLSHELRTPLNAIGGYAQLLEMGVRGPVTPQQADDLRRILRSEQHLLGLINELLNFSRVERGDVPFVLGRVPVRSCIADVLDLIAPQANAKAIAVSIECRDQDLAALADADKLRQVLVNLLTNAVKFTAPGGMVCIDCAGEAAEWVTIQVRDTGIGIPQAKQSVVFDPFVQVHRGSGAPLEGVGLGLAISRGLARGMGGDLTVNSEPGAGSTFELTLARATLDAPLS
jgi:PAS domain S-box-containing protein